MFQYTREVTTTSGSVSKMMFDVRCRELSPRGLLLRGCAVLPNPGAWDVSPLPAPHFKSQPEAFHGPMNGAAAVHQRGCEAPRFPCSLNGAGAAECVHRTASVYRWRCIYFSQHPEAVVTRNTCFWPPTWCIAKHVRASCPLALRPYIRHLF